MNHHKQSLLVASVLIAATLTLPASAQQLPQTNDSYFVAGQAALADRLAVQPIVRRAKNVILFIGDGMGVSTVTASRIYDGQKRGMDGESNSLAMDRFPYLALSKTYSHDAQVADSAPTATAMVTGIKTRNGVLGLDQTVPYGNCAASKGHEVKTIFEIAEGAGLATGVVSTARITHATPAAAYTHSANRDWEDDASTEAAALAAGCGDIAKQLINWPAGDGFEVILGGGRSYFLPKTVADPEDAGQMGRRLAGNLTTDWTAKPNHVYVWDKAGLDKVNIASGAKILGLFETSHMEYEADRAKDKGGEPSLAEMTAIAIERLKQNGAGFVLMVEGGRIDHASHAGNAARALEDTLAFSKAIQAAIDMTSRSDTLIIVTADHSHSLTINGYPDRGNPILGLVKENGKITLGADGKPYTTLSYANGPGGLFPALAQGSTTAAPAGVRPDLTNVDTTKIDFLQQAAVPIGSETHTGDDVAIYSWGPYAHLLQGTVEQNLIYHVTAHALGMNGLTN